MMIADDAKARTYSILQLLQESLAKKKAELKEVEQRPGSCLSGTHVSKL